MIWIVYNDCFDRSGMNVSRDASTLANIKGSRAERIARKRGFFDRLAEIIKSGERIDEFHFFGKSGLYGPIFGFPGWSNRPARRMEGDRHPFAKNANRSLHDGTASRVGSHGSSFAGPSTRRLYRPWARTDDPHVRAPTRRRNRNPLTNPIAGLYDKVFVRLQGEETDEWGLAAKRFAETPQARVVEIGCGNGLATPAIVGRESCTAAALDGSGELIARAVAESAEHKNLEFKRIESPHPALRRFLVRDVALSVLSCPLPGLGPRFSQRYRRAS
jgi:hypothetical protein